MRATRFQTISEEKEVELDTKSTSTFRDRIRLALEKVSTSLRYYSRIVMLSAGLSLTLGLNACSPVLDVDRCTFFTGRLSTTDLSRLYLYNVDPSSSGPGYSSFLVEGRSRYTPVQNVLKTRDYKNAVIVEVKKQNINGTWYWTITQVDYLKYMLNMRCGSNYGIWGTTRGYIDVAGIAFSNGDTKVPVDSEVGRKISEYISYKMANPTDSDYGTDIGTEPILADLLRLQLRFYYIQLSRQSQRDETYLFEKVDLGSWREYITPIYSGDVNSRKYEISASARTVGPERDMTITINKMKVLRSGTALMCCTNLTQDSFIMKLVSYTPHREIDRILGKDPNNEDSWVYIVGIQHSLTEECNTPLSPCAHPRQPPLIVYDLNVSMNAK